MSRIVHSNDETCLIWGWLDLWTKKYTLQAIWITLELTFIKESLDILKTNPKNNKNIDLFHWCWLIWHITIFLKAKNWGCQCYHILSLTSLLLQHLINLAMFINHRHLELIAIMTQSWLCFTLEVHSLNQTSQQYCCNQKREKYCHVKKYITVTMEKN